MIVIALSFPSVCFPSFPSFPFLFYFLLLSNIKLILLQTNLPYFPPIHTAPLPCRLLLPAHPTLFYCTTFISFLFLPFSLLLSSLFRSSHSSLSSFPFHASPVPILLLVSLLSIPPLFMPLSSISTSLFLVQFSPLQG